MELLDFIFQDFWHFIGSLMLISAIFGPIGYGLGGRRR